jgi:dynein light intermediate chain
LYESSIAYGMRKALQAEQSKAEMLIKIQNIEEENQDLEDEVEDLRRRIADKLRVESEGKQEAEEAHQREVEKIMALNQK